MARYLRLNVSGSLEFVRAAGLKEKQAALGGDLELVWIADDLVSYCDEEGKVKGLPANRAANLLVRVCDSGLQSDDIVVGPILLYGGHDANGNDLDFPSSWEAFVRAVAQLPLRPYEIAVQV